ncbi:Uncharacterised protein [Vibrio cholerae]|nr:Uncharacterised protein [Vibrio cholerae]CSI77102.1 Uncharacterised protein [Vibrio cholerae]
MIGIFLYSCSELRIKRVASNPPTFGISMSINTKSMF